MYWFMLVHLGWNKLFLGTNYERVISPSIYFIILIGLWCVSICDRKIQAFCFFFFAATWGAWGLLRIWTRCSASRKLGGCAMAAMVCYGAWNMVCLSCLTEVGVQDWFGLDKMETNPHAAECAGYQHRTTHGIDYWLERGIQACWCLRYARCAEIYEDALPSIGKLSLSWVRSQSAGAIFRMMFVGDVFSSRTSFKNWLEAYFLPEQKPHKDDFLSGCGPCGLYPLVI